MAFFQTRNDQNRSRIYWVEGRRGGSHRVDEPPSELLLAHRGIDHGLEYFFRILASRVVSGRNHRGRAVS